MSDITRLSTARNLAQVHGFDMDADILVGGNYVSLVVHGDVAYVSGQVPRIGSEVTVVGRVGTTVSLEQARLAAKICTLRVLAILQKAVGLEGVARVLKLNVFVQSADDFTQQSEVADAASEMLTAVFGASYGPHARTSVGVAQLPKDAAVELDLMVALAHGSTRSSQ